ncbi:hypothetical protein GGI07_001690 [Coemansia sp. Benny D115]|nr:hypothetical protein GGI07_001690 [Coemansia sp. Benny D115]
MHFFSTVTLLALASVGLALPNYNGEVVQVIGAPWVPVGGGWNGNGYPGGWNGGNGGSNGSGNNGGAGNGNNGSNGNGNGNGNNGAGNNGSDGSGNNGSNGSGNNGSNGSGSNGSGSNASNGSGNNGAGSNGSNGQVGNPSDCGLKPGQKAALTPLVNELKLARTVDDAKHLTKQITDLLGDTLQKDAVSSILNIVDSLAAGLGLGGLDLQATIDSVASILHKQVPCLLDTLLPKP